MARVPGVHEQEHQEICCKSFPGCILYTYAVDRQRAFHTDLTCIYSKNPNLNKTLLCLHFSYTTRGQNHSLYIGDSWFICCTAARCSEMGKMCQLADTMLAASSNVAWDILQLVAFSLLPRTCGLIFKDLKWLKEKKTNIQAFKCTFTEKT